MNLSQTSANQFREVNLNGKWVVSTNLKAELENVSWEEAIHKVGNLNTIADLTFHLNYYIAGLIRVFKGGSLDIRDKYSFDYDPPTSAAEWEGMRQKVFAEAAAFADLVEAMPLEKLTGPFVREEYGDYYGNVHSMIGHTYYHLGQIVLLKKLMRSSVAEPPTNV